MNCESFRRQFQRDPAALDQTWTDWKAAHGRSYVSDAEEASGKATFVENLRTVVDFNLGPQSANQSWLEPNRFADLTFEEFAARYLMTPRGVDPGAVDPRLTRRGPSRRLMALPSTATDMSAFATVVKDQGSCGSCWAFAAVAVAESAVLFKKGLRNSPGAINLSEEQLVGCCNGAACPGSRGCDGGWTTEALNLMKSTGVVGESANPYTSYTLSSGIPTCSVPVSANVKLVSTGVSAAKSGSAIVSSLAANGPVAVYFWVNSKFQLYSGGVLPTKACNAAEMGPYVNHAITVVAYSPKKNASPAYFKIKNSWSTGWGEAGYIRVAAGNDGSAGTCNMYLNGAMWATASATAALPI